MRFKRFIQLVCVLTLLSLFSSTQIKQTLALETTVRDYGLTPANPYVDTGIDVRIGDYLTIRQLSDTSAALYVEGMTVPWIATPGDPGCVAGPNFTLPGVRCWSLIARIGSSNPFYVGFSLNFPVLQTGRLYLGINHELPFIASGFFTVRVIANYVPPPLPPTPFLELPWNHQSSNLPFDKAALEINSYFDHEYPLLSIGGIEPEGSIGVLSFDGLKIPERFYSSHDGYDWGKSAGATIGEPVLAAASGCAIFKNDCGACGNAILINHGNYYQTRYYHLQSTDLVINSTTQCVNVTQGQMIGRVGFSGNVQPPGESGSHLHFMVIEDKDRNGNFDDNIPDGITDPFGWQSEATDPWPNYSWVVGEDTDAITYYGNDSHYLWLHPIPDLNADLPTNGGFFEFQNLKLNFPQNAVKEKTKLEILLAPFVTVSETLESVGTSFIITLKNFFNTPVTTLDQLYSITFDYSNEDLSRVNPETLTIYSSEDGVNWVPEITDLNSTTKTASATLQHLTHFALIGERLDTEPPVTHHDFSQQLNPAEQDLALPDNNDNEAIFPSAVNLTMLPTDNFSGVDYTLYKLNNSDWQEYSAPLEFSEAGTYTLEYYSVDQHENIEETKTTTFEIQFPEIIPEAMITVNPTNFSIQLTATGSGELIHHEEQLAEEKVSHTFSDAFNQSLTLLTKPAHTWLYDQLKVEELTYSPTLESTASGILTVSGLKDKKGVVTMLTTWKTPDYLLTVFFERWTNRTYVVKTEGKQVLSSEKLPGLHLLVLTSNKGIFEYNY